MARSINRLKPVVIQRPMARGYYPDGGGLYLQVTESGAKTWIYRYTIAGRTRDMGLGSFAALSLGEARVKAGEYRNMKAAGLDPVEQRKAKQAAAALEAARARTFDQCAKEYIETHKQAWKNSKHAAQWTATLDTYAAPVIGHLSVQDIDTECIRKVLEPIWITKTETATRVRGRIESILDWAKVCGYRTGENPARWRGHLDQLLPKRSKVQRVKHHPALPYDEIGAFMVELRKRGGVAALALEFTILCLSRTGETIGAKGPEVDLAKKAWTIPADRMKAGKEHRVPLSDRAVEIIKELLPMRRDDSYIFPGPERGKPLSNIAMLALRNRMKRSNITVHGFRSTFRDWASERTSYPNEVCEMALAHRVEDKTEAAYRRGDLFEKRRRLMQEWAKFCGTGLKASANAQ